MKKMRQEAKFKLGQKVFVMQLNTPIMQTVAAVVETSDDWIYYLTNTTTYTSQGYTYEKRQKHTETKHEAHIFSSMGELKNSLFGAE